MRNERNDSSGIAPKPLTVEESHREQLLQSHLSLQRLATFVAVPISIVAFAILYAIDPCWHNLALLIGFPVMAVAWFVAMKFTQRGKLEVSVAIFIASVILYQTMTMMVMNANPGSAMLSLIIMIIYASLFSTKVLIYSTLGVFLSFMGGELIRWLRPWEPKVFDAMGAFLFEMGFVVLLLPLAAIVLRRSHKMKDALVEQMTGMNKEQTRIITTAKEVAGTLADVVQQLEEFSVAFAAQTAEQASAIAETNVVMDQIRKIAGNTAASAAKTRNIAEQTREKSQLTSSQLKAVENGFSEVMDSNDSARTEFFDLASQAESIEEVLRVNRNIAAQIKILAVNAGIQAAKAGEYGAGFNVVAKELKSMIQDTDTSLEDSRQLLEGIRKRARQSAETIQTSSTLLRKHAGDLNTTGSLIEEISASFVDTSRQFSQISESAKEQQARLNEVSGGMSQIDVSAAELNKQTSILVESVQRISSSQASLGEILSRSAEDTLS